MSDFLAVIAAIIVAAVLIVVIGAMCGFFIMLLWNWLIPIVVPGGQLVGTITFLQGWGLAVLVGLIFPKSTQTCSKD